VRQEGTDPQMNQSKTGNRRSQIRGKTLTAGEGSRGANHVKKVGANLGAIRICFSYQHAKVPVDGTNSFARVLRDYVSRSPQFTIVDDLRDDYDLLFLNQLNRSPSARYSMSEIRAALDGGRKKKVVVRAINLQSKGPAENPPRNLRHSPLDRWTLELVNSADHVIFQSAFQKEFFQGLGYKGRDDSVIHNGAAPIFLNVRGGAKRLRASDALILVSSSMSTTELKRHDIIAALSLLPKVRVIHVGQWPPGLDQKRVFVAGVLSHAEMARLFERSHYFLHPAICDVCPNSLIEGLCAGLPVIYNPRPGSGSELGSDFGIALNEGNLSGTIARARQQYERLVTALSIRRQYYSIGRAAPCYMNVFKALAAQSSERPNG
jgi:glycosyltransferase involved in cell wall biosynthesis